MPYKDPQKKKEFDKKYNEKNHEKLLIKRKEWKKNNKDLVKISSKKYREKHKEQLKDYYVKNSKKIIARERLRYETKKDEILEKRKEFYKNNKDKILKKNRVRKYKLTNEDYDWLLDEQDGRCAICLMETKLCVDHDHKTGKVRGLLCGHCNKALGFIREDVSLLESIKNYLK